MDLILGLSLIVLAFLTGWIVGLLDAYYHLKKFAKESEDAIR